MLVYIMGNKLLESECTAADAAMEEASANLKVENARQAKKLERLRKKMAKKPLGTNRGVETMFRNTSRANYELIAFADNKASIMIGVNGFLLSILLASAGSIFNESPWLALPLIAFMLTNFASIVCSVLAAYPNKVSDNKISIQDVRDMKPNANLLFFGTSANMNEDDFLQATQEMLQDSDFLYRTMTLDNRNIGMILLKKFRMLSLAYKTFLSGLVITLLLAVGSYITSV